MASPILIVDDNKDINLNLECFFEDHNIPSIGCFSGEEALEQVKSHPECHRAIVNLRLPGMDGEKLIAELKLVNPDLHILIHTGALEFTLTDVLRSLGLEDDDIFYKPQAEMGVFIERFAAKEKPTSED